MTQAKVLVSNVFEIDHLNILQNRFPTVRFIHLPKDCSVPSEGADAEILLRCAMDKDELSRTLQNAPAVRWVHTSTAGFDWVIVPEVEERNIMVSRSAASKAVPIAEYVVAFIFQMAKCLPALARAQIDHQWTRPDPDEVRGKLVGVVGAGAIGCEVARLCAGLGMRVMGTKRNPEPIDHFEVILPVDELPRLLSESDYVVLSCPLTPETQGLVGALELRQMKSTAYLINIARGSLVVESDLVQALRGKWIAGACLDVFEEEPLSTDSPLWDLENLVVTPHCSWGSPHSLNYVMEEFIINLERYLAGQKLLNQPKNLKLGY